ncbi:TetR family transcriptional regulator [Corynebacterium lizhenjunii]|uniref:TetR family transcriptional regulator n=1 Tax=Corynebacterium lizhenjunii TaxID=2709394 RepID=A0A7T0KDA1_9CORY|nr:TetR/AcrR family transcriptional regulator [Corynebacterium lizhenjunii]QPK78665.1 TetR family transcriptional regulator [Corynebacterium lizhenjunii]
MAAEDTAANGATQGGTPPADVTAQRIADIALKHFAQRGYTSTKLEAIAIEAGISKRMVHYYFADKEGLYHEALTQAARKLTPDVAHMEIDSAVPVEGVRKLVDIVFHQYVTHPEAVRLLTQASVVDGPQPTAPSLGTDLSELTLHMNRLLLTGQDAGAFRPGISAQDVFTLIASLAMYGTTNALVMDSILGVDMSSEANTAGLHRLVVDTVLAFLTSNIPATGQDSYLSVNQLEEHADSSDTIYGSEHDIYA